MDLLDLFTRASAWTAERVPAAADQLDAPTPCTEWKVRDLLNHMIDTQNYFAARGRGEDAPLPNPSPPSLIGSDPVSAFTKAREELLRVYADPKVVEKTGPSLGIAFSDQLIHGCDLARATGQDASMPEDLAEAALTMVGGMLTPERRGNAFAPEAEVGDDATVQQKLLAFMGRQP